ncbi:MAG: SapC family protein [Desulfuromonas sp.]|nr:SapC family protein [Desulfuromonas sp.]
MAKIVPITKTEFGAKLWRRYSSYSFAAGDAIAPLVMQELPKAQLSLPIGFALKDGQAFPVAVQGLKPGVNMLVNADGSWRGRYIPAAYRGYPFVLADTEDNKQVLCIDADSDLVSDTEGEPFFTPEGEPSKALSEVLSFLQQINQDRMRTLEMCKVLQKHNLLQPWPIKVKFDTQEQQVDGLFRVDERALNALEYDAYKEVSKAGVLPLAYCQLLSMQHLQDLGRLYSDALKQQGTTPEVPDVDKIFGEKVDDDLFNFNF